MKLSIITINRNNADGLRRTIESVVSQTYTDFEYIVVDGSAPQPPKGGVLGDMEVLADFIKEPFSTKKNFTSCTWLSPKGGVGGGYFSEPDSGIYNAMNKGIQMASGEFLLFINSGDELADNHVVENFQNVVKPDSEICSGNLLLINNSAHLNSESPTQISLSYCINAGLTHPNTFIRKSLFDKYGLYNEANKIVSDWEFFLVAAGLNNCNYQKLDFTVARFYEDGISSANKKLVQFEMEQVIAKLIPEPVIKDIKRIQQFDELLSHPANKLVQQSTVIRKLLLVLYKLRRKIQSKNVPKS